MATIDAGAGRRGKRTTNHELPLVPFIDFLICLVVFLLAQVGFANIARLQSNANVPGKSSDQPVPTPKLLHVDGSGSTRLDRVDKQLRPILMTQSSNCFEGHSQAALKLHRAHSDETHTALQIAFQALHSVVVGLQIVGSIVPH